MAPQTKGVNQGMRHYADSYSKQERLTFPQVLVKQVLHYPKLPLHHLAKLGILLQTIA